MRLTWLALSIRQYRSTLALSCEGVCGNKDSVMGVRTLLMHCSTRVPQGLMTRVHRDRW